MQLKTFPGGIHPHDQKHFSKDAAISILPTPNRVIIHLSQHIGAPSAPIVEVGEVVLKGQTIAEATGFVSLAQHASISGKISKIGKFMHPTGVMSTAIEITSDGANRMIDLCDDENFLELEPQTMKERIAAAGLCGMGGAGFPSYVKLSPPADKPIDLVILNGVECEPYLTSDYRLMLERSADILHGLKLIMKVTGAQKGMIGIEANKPDAIAQMTRLCAKEKNLEVVALKMQYPQGAEKQLIFAASGRKVPAGGLPMAVGVVVQNVGTAVAIYEAVRYQKPLIERIISVTGSVVKQPKNILAPIGTLYSELVEFCSGTTEEIGKAISGGPMMGFALPSLDAAITKGSSGLVLLNTTEAKSAAEHTCLRCARCVDVCPMNLMPSMIANAVKYKDLDMAVKAGLNDCIKCGSCAYVCPAQIRLVQWIDTGKIRYAEAQRNK
ncbi:MAG: electron transport complex subunit RsxC [Candidatus Cloacimonetes bacterium]|jgi:electron transport complex protein RnfC|nr:electron transport complex subunit RsxC [Candidatus Cloacimonadota bacterium]MDY0299167.1 electron transport complex subunit RsxC [Candidatus Cloacimonadaceae bacterium]MCB5279833.1 electron transport complex subunit RsxC [Candidatus Cloacimonadota bacterium]MCK9332072.1 electron transport complex subunit RsxC [Candidatus Cloacimonadota bacterium]MDD2210923.1 electron transport complex subunit RsxC [Candidatus Cloacimonadota bacterium]